MSGDRESLCLEAYMYGARWMHAHSLARGACRVYAV
jgi:hypothetical protein